MTTLNTHDTKRSADVRSRLDALTTMPERWLRFVDRWLPWCEDRWLVEPHRPTTVLALQTVVGAWPIDADRLRRYLEKATKEAKTRTSWTTPDTEFDDAVSRFADEVLADERFVADVEALVDEVFVPGRHIALAKQLLQLTSPGVPDCYQGSELWDLSLVDPDNRRRVDHGLRAELSTTLESDGGPEVALADDRHGEHKLWVTRQALGLRRRRPECFGPGAAGRYEPVDVGAQAVAFCRGDDVMVGAALACDGGFELPLPDGEWTDLLSGTRHHGTVAVDGLVLLERGRS